MSDEDLFAEEMAGVKPLAREARVRLTKEKLSEDQQQGRRRAAEGHEEAVNPLADEGVQPLDCLLYTSPSPRDKRQSRMPSSA